MQINLYMCAFQSGKTTCCFIVGIVVLMFYGLDVTHAYADWTDIGRVNGTQVYRDNSSGLEWTVTIGQVQSSGNGTPAQALVEKYGFRLPSFNELQVMEKNGGFRLLKINTRMQQYYETSDSNTLAAAWGNGFRTPQIRRGIGKNWVIGVRQGNGGDDGGTSKETAIVHLITVADLNGTNSIGSRIGADMFYSSMYYGLGINQPNDYRFTEEELTPKIILEQIKNMPINKNDTVVFYYTGHGAYDANRGLFFTIADPRDPYNPQTKQGGKNVNSLLKNDVLAAIQKHSPRLTVIISDCCSAYLVYADECAGSAGAAHMDPTCPLFKKLFFESSGVIDFTGAQEGKVSYVTNGPYGPWMTNALCQSFDVNHNKTIGWKQLFSNVQQKTVEYSKARYSADPNAINAATNENLWRYNGVLQIPQKPRAFSLGD